MKHRLYSDRVLQLSDDVSMIILLPPVDQVCLLPGHDENHLEPSLHSCIDVPLHVFEISKSVSTFFILEMTFTTVFKISGNCITAIGLRHVRNTRCVLTKDMSKPQQSSKFWFNVSSKFDVTLHLHYYLMYRPTRWSIT